MGPQLSLCGERFSEMLGKYRRRSIECLDSVTEEHQGWDESLHQLPNLKLTLQTMQPEMCVVFVCVLSEFNLKS